MKVDLQYIAARMAFDKVSAQEIRDLADHVMEDGCYADEFLSIMESNPPTLRDVLAPFRAYLGKEGIAIPDKDTAVWQIIQYHVSRMTAGTVRPLEGLKRLIADVYMAYDFQNQTKKYLGDSHGIEHLIGLYWGYDDMRERPAEVSCNAKYGEEGLLELEKEILKCAQEWMKTYADKGVLPRRS